MSGQAESIKGLRARVKDCAMDVSNFERELSKVAHVMTYGETLKEQLDAHANAIYHIKALDGAREKLKYLKELLRMALRPQG